MKRYFLFFFILFCSCNVFSKTTKIFIYVDISSSDDVIDLIQDSIKKIIFSNEDDFVLYVSNGNKPLVITSRYKLIDNLNKLYLENFKEPDYKKDIYLINEVLLKNKLLSNISNNTEANNLENELNFYFFLNKDSFFDFNLESNLINKLLFSNKLYFSSGLHKDCNVHIYEDNNFKLTKKDIR